MQYEKSLQHFNNKFHKLLKKTETPFDGTWYSNGIQLVLDTDSISMKEDILNKMLAIYPTQYELYYYMGCIYKESRPYMALSWYRMCFKLNPKDVDNILDYVQTLFNLGLNSHILKWDEDNNKILQRSEDPRIFFLYATIRLEKGDLGYAIFSYNNILERIHTMPESNIIFVYLNYAYLLSKIGYLKDAFIHYTKRIFPWLKTNENADFLQTKEAKLAIKSLYENYVILFDYIYHNFQERYSLCRFMYNKLYRTSHIYTHNPRTSLNLSQQICVGYVSSDFQNHAVSNFILPIIHNHSSSFQIHLFSQKQIDTTAFSKDIVIHNIQFVSDDECAKLIYDSNIDILFDLNGYTNGNRLGIFAKCPSPIQVNYLGYPNSLCLDFIKYRITDEIADYKNSKQIYTETRIYLPKCFLLYESFLQSSPIERPVKDAGEPILFGSLNKELKTSENTLNAWACILNNIPTSRILIKIDSNDMHDSRLNYYTHALNIDASRIDIVCKCSDTEYIQLFSRIDILLDTFPYSGTTTTCNALYNSVPMITLYNRDYHCNNVSSSILMNAGLGDYIAYSTEEYIEKVVKLANSVRSPLDTGHIHDKFMKLMDKSRFMTDYENSLIQLYKYHWKL